MTFDTFVHRGLAAQRAVDKALGDHIAAKPHASFAADYANGERLVVDYGPRCVGGSHCWPAEFKFGDTCYCGHFYLLQDQARRMRVVERDPNA